MKTDIHPDYGIAVVTCGCGASFKTRSTSPKIQVEICSECHPFYTGKQKLVDAAGQIEKFRKRWAKSGKGTAEAEEGAESGEAEAAGTEAAKS